MEKHEFTVGYSLILIITLKIHYERERQSKLEHVSYMCRIANLNPSVLNPNFTGTLYYKTCHFPPLVRFKACQIFNNSVSCPYLRF